MHCLHVPEHLTNIRVPDMSQVSPLPLSFDCHISSGEPKKVMNYHIAIEYLSRI